MNVWIKHKFADDPAIYVCPHDPCATPFSTLKEWKRHVLTEKHDIYEGYIENQHLPLSLHEQLKLKFDDANLDQDLLNTMKSIMEDYETARHGVDEQVWAQRQLWGEKGSSKRWQYELAFLAQLELDPQWEGSSPVKNCFIWEELQRDMDGEA